jgi:hypothetical protein
LANASGLEALNLPALAIEAQTKQTETQGTAMAIPMHHIRSEKKLAMGVDCCFAASGVDGYSAGNYSDGPEANLSQIRGNV